MSKLFAEFNALNLTDKNFGSFGNFNTCKSGDGNGLLTYYLSIKRAVDDYGLAYLLGLLGV